MNNLLTEYTENPLGLDIAKPRFSWTPQLPQTAYCIRVFVDEAQGKTSILWNSGVVESRLPFCDYAGAPLQSMTRYRWTVCLRDETGSWTDESPSAYFEMALLEESLWQGSWIGPTISSNIVWSFRNEISLSHRVVKARAYLATVGFSELWVNGEKAGKNVLDPANTDYDKHIHYVTYDISEQLQQGENAIGILLSKGWATHEKFLLQVYIWLENGDCVSLFSDAKNTIMFPSPILSATVYSGEIYCSEYERPDWCLPVMESLAELHKEDWSFFCTCLPRRREDNPGLFDQYSRAYYIPFLLPVPQGKLVAQMVEPIQVMQELLPASINQLGEHHYVIDFGQNFAGWIAIQLSTDKQEIIEIKHSEILCDDGTLNMEYLSVSDPSNPLPMQTDYYFTKGIKGESFEPRFTYHGFRYAEIIGYTGELSELTIVGKVVHSSVSSRSSFSSGNSLINQIQSNVLWTERSNLYSIPTDCPQRSERQGWLNDLTVRAEESIYNFELKRFYEKFLLDIRDTQDPVSGAIADTAPFRRGNYPADPTVSSYVILPLLLYNHYADLRVVEKYYEGVKLWTEYLRNNSKDGIVSFSFYGDWVSPATCCHHHGTSTPISAITSGTFISTGYYYYNLCLLVKYAQELHKPEDEKLFRTLQKQVGKQLHQAFFDPEKHQYDRGSQGANVFALWLHIVPKKEISHVLNNLKADLIEKDYHITTGNQMTKCIFEVLCEYGEIDLAYRLVTQTTYPSWGYMIQRGATTVWERWEYETGFGMNSHNHPLLCSISGWFYKYLLGITPAIPGFVRTKIKPYLPSALDYAAGKVKTIFGTVAVEWKKEGKQTIFRVEVPTGIECEIHLPLAEKNTPILLNGVPAKNRAAIYNEDEKQWRVLLLLTGGNTEIVVG